MNGIHGMLLLESQHRNQLPRHPSSQPPIPAEHHNPDQNPFPVPPTSATGHAEEQAPEEGPLLKEPMIRSILYFRGFGRQKIWRIRRLCQRLQIPEKAIQHISLIGANVAELIVPASLKGEVVDRLERARIMHHPTFDPLAPTSFTNPATTDRLNLTAITDAKQHESAAARLAFLSRISTMLQEISPHRKGLTSFLSALKRAVEDGAPITRFLNQ